MNGVKSVRTRAVNGPVSCAPNAAWQVGGNGDSTVIWEQGIKASMVYRVGKVDRVIRVFNSLNPKNSVNSTNSNRCVPVE